MVGEADVAARLVPVTLLTLVVRTRPARATGGVILGVRPHAWHLGSPSADGFALTVTVVEELGGSRRTSPRGAHGAGSSTAGSTTAR
jgi:hypothetical protein